jgi:hypothetical protein
MLYDAAENNFAESGVCCHESIIRSMLPGLCCKDFVCTSLLSGVCCHGSIIRSLLPLVYYQETVATSLLSGLCREDANIRTLLQGVCWQESIIRSLLHGVESVSSRTSQGLKIPRVGIFPNVQVSSSLSTSLDAVCTESSLPEPVRTLDIPILQAQLDQRGHQVDS